MDGVIGFDYNAVFEVAKILKVDLNKYVLDKIQRIEYYEVKRMNGRNG